MKKLLKLTVLFLILSNSLFAQYIPFVEEGKFWMYINSINSDFPQSVSGHAITFQGDTVINSETYKKVYRISLKGSDDCPPEQRPCWSADRPYQSDGKSVISYIREDTLEKKIYNLPKSKSNLFCGVGEYLLFDFSLTVGDTLNSCVYGSILADDTFDYPGGIVDSIKTIEAEGKYRRALFTYGFFTGGGLPFPLTIPIAEGLGYEDFGIFNVPLSSFFDYCEGELGECDLLISTEVTIGKHDLYVFPNPSDGRINVSNNLGQIESITAYSSLGQIVGRSTLSSTIDLSDFENGVYILEITLADNTRVIRKVIKE